MALRRWSVVVSWADAPGFWALGPYWLKRSADRKVRVIEAGRGRLGCACTVLTENRPDEPKGH